MPVYYDWRYQKFMYEVAQRKAMRDYDDWIATLRQSAPSDIAKEASDGVVIEGVAVRKPQPRLT